MNNEYQKKKGADSNNTHFIVYAVDLFSWFKYSKDKSMITHNISLFEVDGGEIKICQQYTIYSYPQGATQVFVIK